MKNPILRDGLVLARASALISGVVPLLYFLDSRYPILQSPLTPVVAVASPFLISAAAARSVGRLTARMFVAWVVATGVVYIASYNVALWNLRTGGPGNLWPIEIAIMTARTLGAQAVGFLLGRGSRKILFFSERSL